MRPLFGLLLLCAASAAQGADLPQNRIDVRVSRTDYLSIWKPDLLTGLTGYFGREFEFDLPHASVVANGVKLGLEKLSLRGQSCKSAERKCLSVKSKTEPRAPEFGGSTRVKATDFNLVSMWQDEGYLSNKLCYGLLNALGMIRLRTAYTRLAIHHPVLPGLERSHEMGLYLVTEKPDRVMRKELGSPWIVRRGTNDRFELEHLDETHRFASTFDGLLRELYTWARELRGRELYDRVSERLDLEGYFRWLTFNTLVRNQDFQDEIFLYADADRARDGTLFLRVFPWDFDDVFQDEATGLLARFKKVITRADTLDQALARDPLFERRYRQVAREMLGRLDDQMIDRVAAQVARDIAPYLTDEVLALSSDLDGKATPHTATYIRSLLAQRVTELKARRRSLLAGP